LCLFSPCVVSLRRLFSTSARVRQKVDGHALPESHEDDALNAQKLGPRDAPLEVLGDGVEELQKAIEGERDGHVLENHNIDGGVVVVRSVGRSKVLGGREKGKLKC